MVLHVTEIVEEVGRVRFPGRKDRALVIDHPRHLDQRPLGAVEIGIELLVHRHADQRAVGGIAPIMVGAGEQRRVALVVAAYLHATMPAGVEKDVDAVLLIAAQDHRFAAHPGREVVAGVGDLALMADEQPGARKQPLQFLAKIPSLTKISRLMMPRWVSTRRSAIVTAASFGVVAKLGGRRPAAMPFCC